MSVQEFMLDGQINKIDVIFIRGLNEMKFIIFRQTEQNKTKRHHSVKTERRHSVTFQS